MYPIQLYISKNIYPPTLCLKGTQKPTNLYLSPKCCHDISNTNIYIQLTYIPQTVGSIYPIQINIFKNVHSLTLGPKGTQKPSKLHSSSKFRHEISISAFQLSRTAQQVTLSLTHSLTDSLTQLLTFTFAIQRAILETCYH